MVRSSGSKSLHFLFLRSSIHPTMKQELGILENLTPQDSAVQFHEWDRVEACSSIRKDNQRGELK